MKLSLSETVKKMDDQERLSTYFQKVETSLEKALLSKHVKSCISLYNCVCEGFAGKGLGMKILLSHYDIEKYIAIDKNTTSIKRIVEENPAFRSKVLLIEGDFFNENIIQTYSPYVKKSLFLMIGQLHHLQDNEIMHIIKNVPADRFLVLERCLDENLGEDLHNYMLLHRFEEVLQRINRNPVETLRYIYEYTNFFESNGIKIDFIKKMEHNPFYLPDFIKNQYIKKINDEIDTIYEGNFQEALKKEFSFLIDRISYKIAFPPLYVMMFGV